MRHLLSLIAGSAAAFAPLSAVVAASDGASAPPVAAPPALAVQAKLPAPPKDTADLKFGEMFALPVGPRGLEPSAKLRALDGAHVRLIGYMVRGNASSSSSFLLSPLPVTAGDEDESLADDIPASAVLIHVQDGKRSPLPQLVGLIRLTGILRVGTITDEASGRNAAASLDLDASSARALRQATPARRRNPDAKPVPRSH